MGEGKPAITISAQPEKGGSAKKKRKAELCIDVTKDAVKGKERY